MPDLKRILLVEDSKQDVELTLSALEEHHLANEVVVARDGAEALDYLLRRGKHAARPDELPAVVLLDLKLPKVSGLDVLRRIRADATTRRMPVVILTSSREEQDMAASYDLGVNSYIRKPVDFERFVQSVGQLGLYWLVLNEEPPKLK